LAKALFRIVPPTAGRILLDGVDTAAPALTRMRKGMAMVSQDPTLFEGTGAQMLMMFQ
jgi:ABC-type multidrug transport system fused ATPase/permease subunit